MMMTLYTCSHDIDLSFLSEEVHQRGWTQTIPPQRKPGTEDVVPGTMDEVEEPLSDNMNLFWMYVYTNRNHELFV